MEISIKIIKIINYQLKERVEGQNSKITLSGSNFQTLLLLAIIFEDGFREGSVYRLCTVF